ncbi:unnamed protein product, partial [Mesorhabditis spiculigera]
MSPDTQNRNNAAWAALLEVKAEGNVAFGAGVTGDFSITLTGSKLYFHCKGELVFGPGCGGGFGTLVDFEKIAELMFYQGVSRLLSEPGKTLNEVMGQGPDLLRDWWKRRKKNIASSAHLAQRILNAAFENDTEKAIVHLLKQVSSWRQFYLVLERMHPDAEVVSAVDSVKRIRSYLDRQQAKEFSNFIKHLADRAGEAVPGQPLPKWRPWEPMHANDKFETLLAAKENSVISSHSLSDKQVNAIADRIDQRYPKQPASQRHALLQQVVTAIDNMVFVEGGTFEMGDFGWVGEYDPANMCEWPCGLSRDELWFLIPEADSRPLHTVRLDSFYMSKYHTTIKEDDLFRHFTGLPQYRMQLTDEDRADNLTQPYRVLLPELFLPDLPARSRFWQEAKDYCLWMGDISGFPIDLPTEAQYEYAARSGGRYLVYATDNGSINEGRNISSSTDVHQVGAYPPNPLGLYDMGANAVSWVNDWYSLDYYQNSPVDNPQGPATGSEKVRRGSDSVSTPQLAMTMWRLHDKPDRVLSSCNQHQAIPSKSLSDEQVKAIAERIDQRYPKQPASQRHALVQQVVTAVDNMVFVEGGTFEMGDFGWVGEYDPANMCEWPCGLSRDELWFLIPEADSRPLHTVRLDSFYMSKYHTTIKEDDLFRHFTGLPQYRMQLTDEDRADNLTQPYRVLLPDLFLPDFPARSRFWQEAKNYCLWLGEVSGLPVDLPTEAQYEYAARSGGRYVVYSTDSGSIIRGKNVHDGKSIYPVGYFPANPLGLYEMGDNAVSWVNDWYGADYYQNSPVENPQGPEIGTEKVQRGSTSLWTPQLAMTMWRHRKRPDIGEYLAQNSYRCAIQQILSGCNQHQPIPSKSLSAEQVKAIAERIDQRYPKQPASQRHALVQQVVTAIDNMVFVAGGTFEMGDFGWAGEYDPANMCEWPCGLSRDELWFLIPEADSRPLHTVRLDSFYMSKYHTTIAEDDQYRAFNELPFYNFDLTDEDKKNKQTHPYRVRNPELFNSNYPARSRVWQEAKNYCLWLGELSGLSVDLPTEAQYEYAARSGGRYVVYSTDSGSVIRGKTLTMASRFTPWVPSLQIHSAFTKWLKMQFLGSTTGTPPITIRTPQLITPKGRKPALRKFNAAATHYRHRNLP